MEQKFLIETPNENMSYNVYGIYAIKRINTINKTILEHKIYKNEKIVKEMTVYLDDSGHYLKSILKKKLGKRNIILKGKKQNGFIELNADNNLNSYKKNLNYNGNIIDLFQLEYYIIYLIHHYINLENLAILDLEKGIIINCLIEIRKYSQNEFIAYLWKNDESQLIFQIMKDNNNDYKIKKILSVGYVLNLI